MATPTSNSVSTPAINQSGLDPLVRALLDGRKWGSSSLGAGVTLTYSLPSGTASFTNPYGNGEFNAWYATNGIERAAIAKALGVWSQVANVHFSKVADTSTVVGELRFALTDNSVYAHAYTPDTFPEAGDVWFHNGDWHANAGDPIAPGSYEYLTILHEIGHALGLKHPFEGAVALPAHYDNYFYTIMSYTAKQGLASNFATFYPTTPMYLDYLAMQTLYGEALSSNNANTVYTFTQGHYYWETIFDTGGIDTMVFNGTSGSRIDLSGHTFSKLTRPIEFSNGSTSRDTVSIGPGTVIERATGGSGSDVLIGNTANNVLKGRGGADVLSGGSGGDVIDGGAGRDKLTGGADTDRFDFNSLLDSPTSGQRDTIKDFLHGTDRIDLAGIDADGHTGNGNQAFHFIGSQSFSGHRAELRFAGGLLLADADGDRHADLVVQVVGGGLTLSDLVL